MARRVKVWVQAQAGRANLLLQWHDPDTGARRTRSAGTTVRRDAEAAAADLEYELNHGRKAGRPSTWPALRERFESEYAAELRPKSARTLAGVLDVFEQLCRPKSIDKLTGRTVALFAKGMRTRPCRGRVGLAPITRRNYLVALKTCLAWAHKQKLIDEMPVFPQVRVPKTRPKPVPQGDWDKLVAVAPDATWRAYLMAAWWAGLRLSETYALRRTESAEFPWHDMTSKRIVFPAKFVKSNEDQWVPVHPTLAEALAAVPDVGDRYFPFASRKGGADLTEGGLSSYVRLLAKRAGVRMSYHKLRKGFGCRVAQQLGRGDAPILHRLMRHSSMQMTMDCYSSVDDVLHGRMDGLT